MNDSTLFSNQPTDRVPSGQDQEAIGANPSPLSGTNAPVVRPVWESFVTNTVAIKHNREAVAEEQRQMREAARAENQAPLFKGVNGKLIRKVGRQTDVLDPEQFVDDPIAGPEARRSLWDREIQGSKKASSNAKFLLQNPEFKARELAQKDREDIEAQLHGIAVTTGPDYENNEEYRTLKGRLIADTEYREEKTRLEKEAWDHEARARLAESQDPETWWSSRPEATEARQAQRQQVVAEAQATRQQASAADAAAAQRETELRAKLAQGVKAGEAVQIRGELDQITKSRQDIAAIHGENEQQVEQVRQQAEAQIKKPEKEFFRVDDTISGIWDAVKGLGVTAPAAFYQLIEGLDRPDQYSDSAKAAFAEADAYMQEMQAKTEANQAAGTSSSVGESFREAGGSLGFSLGSMAAAIPASIAGGKVGALTGAAIGGGGGAVVGGVGAVPGAGGGAVVGGLIGGVSAGMAASGAAAYRMAGASFLNEAFQTIEAESMRKNGRPMNEAEKASAYEALLPIAKNTALWEAGPEAVGNAVSLGAGKIIFGLGKPLMKKFMATIGGKIATKAGAGAAALGTELATETITQVEQGADQQKMQAIAQGQDPNAIKADWSAGGVVEAFKEVAPQTLALMGLMGGAGGAIKVGAMGVNKIMGKEAGPATVPEAGTVGPPPVPQVNEGLASIDPEAPPASPEEVTGAAFMARPTDGPKEYGELVLASRELVQVGEQHAQEVESLREQLSAAQVSGDKGAVAAQEAALERAEASPNPAALGTAVLKIAAGKDLTDLTTEELAAIGYESKPGKPDADGNAEIGFTPIKTEKGKERPVMVRAGADGSIILTDEALKAVEQVSPRTRARVTMTEAETIAKANQRQAERASAAESAATGGDTAPGGEATPASPTGSVAGEYDVALRDGSTIRVPATNPQEAEEEAAARADYGNTVVPGSAFVVQKTPVRETQTPKASTNETQKQSSQSDSTSKTVQTGAAAGKTTDGKTTDNGVRGTDTNAGTGEKNVEQGGGDGALPGFPKGVTRGKTVIEVLTGPNKGRHTVIGTSTKGTVAVIGKSGYGEDVEPGNWKISDDQKSPANNNPNAPSAKPIVGKIKDGEPGSRAKEAAEIRIATIGKRSPRLADSIKETGDPDIYAELSLDGKTIWINTERIIKRALELGMTEARAARYFANVLDEEIRHMAYNDAARSRYAKIAKKAGIHFDEAAFENWRKDYYGEMWRTEFVATGKAKYVKAIYSRNIAEGQTANFDNLHDWQKLYEATRAMSQKGRMTEVAKLWVNISAPLRELLEEALAALRAFSELPSETLRTEIKNLENALRTLTETSPSTDTGTRGQKPAANVAPGGNRKPTETKRDSGPAINGQTEQAPRTIPVSTSLVGSKVEFTRDGQRLAGVVTLDRGSAIRVKLDEPDSEGVPTRLARRDELRVIESPEWVAFAEDSGTLGIPRSEMPQVKAEDRSAMVQFLKARGIDYREEEVRAGDLKPTQAEFSPKKVAKARAYEGGDRAILISSDGHLIDGHHQWLSKESDERIRVIRFDGETRDIIETAKQMPSVTMDEASAPEAEAVPTEDTAELAPPIAESAPSITPRDRNQFPGEDYPVPANVVFIQPRGLDTEPMSDRVFTYEYDGTAADAAKVGARGFVELQGQFPEMSQRESLFRASGEDGMTKFRLTMDEVHNKVRVDTFTPKRAKVEAAPEVSNDTAQDAKPAKKPKKQAAPEAPPAKNTREVTLDDGRVLQVQGEGAATYWRDPTATQGPGAGAFLLASPEFRAKIEAAEAKPETTSQEIGRNANGDQIFADSNGVRYLEDSGFKITQPVEVRPTRAGVESVPATPLEMFKRGNRRFLTEQELEQFSAKEKAPSVAPAAPPADPALDAAMQQAKDVLKGLFTSELPDDMTPAQKREALLPKGFDQEIPQDRFMALMGAANALVQAGVNTPEKLAKAMDELAEDRKALPYTQRFWNAMQAAGAKGKAEPKWAAIYGELDKQAAQADIATDDSLDGRGSGTGDSDTGSDGLAGDRNQGGNPSGVPQSPDAESDSGGTGTGRPGQRPGQPAVSGSGDSVGGRSGSSDGSTQEQPDTNGASGTDSGVGGNVDGNGSADAPRPDAVKKVRPEAGSPEANFVIDDDFQMPASGKARITANIKAIELLRKIEQEGRNATEDEKKILSAYSGWGSFKEAFNDIKQAKWVDLQNDIEAVGSDSWQANNIRRRKDYQELAAWRNNWGELHDQVSKLLEPDEFRAMSKSVLNAHYTALPVIDGMWKLLKRLGFKGGPLLENSAGGGYFIGRQPSDLADVTDWSAIELDEITSRVLAKLYPEVRVNGTAPAENRQVVGQGFQDSKIPNNSILGVIGNFPFAKDGPGESQTEFGQSLNLHNYFFARSRSKLQPGGIIVAITSASTMDNNLLQRELLANNTELVGAIRLPNSAFKDSAGTEVTTDILVLRKNDGSRDTMGAKWLNTAQVGEDVVTSKPSKDHGDVHDWLSSIPAEWVPVNEALREPFKAWRVQRPRTGEKWKAMTEALKDARGRDANGTATLQFTAPVTVNEYFMEHPEMALGKHSLQGSMYSADEYALTATEGDLMEKLNAAIETFPENIIGANIEAELANRTREADQGDRDGSTVIRDGKVFDVVNGQLQPVQWETELFEKHLDTFLKGDEDLAELRKLSEDGDMAELREWIDGKLANLSATDRAKIETKTAAALAKRHAAFKAWAPIRDAAKKIVDSELAGAADEKLAELRTELNTAYDAYVKEFGAINKRGHTNAVRFLDDDIDTPLVESLEDEEMIGTTDKGTPIYRYVKRPIFTGRILPKIEAPSKAESVPDAIAVSMGYMGRLSVPYMAQLLDKTEAEVTRELNNSGLAMVNPATGLFEISELYLSGEVRTKLIEAEKANVESGGQYQANVDALKAIMPPPSPISGISITMGARWIPNSVYTAFVNDVLKLPFAQVEYQPNANIWKIANGGTERGKKRTSTDAANADSFETPRYTALEILDAVLNSKKLEVWDSVTGGGSVLNTEQTLIAQAKANEMQGKFIQWLRSSEKTVEVDGRARKVGRVAEDSFNEKVGGVIPPSFTGDWVTLPGQSGEIYLLKHRLAVLARMITTGYGMMAHGVGSGKTYNLIALAMELRRLGKARKTMTIVQGSTIRQFAASHMKAYPQARILVADAKNFSARKRARFLARVATGDYDSIILTHSAVGNIGHSAQSIRNYMAKAFAELDEALKNAESGSDNMRDIQKVRDKLQERMDKMLASAAKNSDKILTWEQLGVDALLVDEAHTFKNIPIVTRKDRVKNMPTGSSDRAILMQMKCAAVQRVTGGKNVFFATGTPITNTMAEAYAMLNFVAPEVLANRQIKNFDDFISTFCRTVSEPEATWKGEIENVERLAKFINGPELINIVRSVFDVALGNENLGLRVPKMKGGAPKMVMIEPTESSEIFNDWVIDTAAEFKAIPNKREAFKEDPWMQAIPIMVMQAGMAQAIDPRLINPLAPDDPNSKVNKAVADIHRIWLEGKERRTAQVVFSDLNNPFSTYLLRKFNGDPFEEFGTEGAEIEALEEQIFNLNKVKDKSPAVKKAIKKLGKDLEKLRGKQFSVFADIKAKLVKLGIPPKEIAIAADMSKEALENSFDKVNDGTIRIIMGSTEKLGVGVNIQERLAAAHNISPPRDFKPAMMEQRIGRIIRQGNLFRDWADQAYLDVVEEHSGRKFEGKDLAARFKAAEKWVEENGDMTAEGSTVRELAEAAADEFSVEVLNYGLKLSMDSAVYSMMKAKQGFIEQILMGIDIMDEFDDPASAEALGYALMAAEAMGNEDLKRRVMIMAEVQKLDASRNADFADKNRRQDAIRSAKSSLRYAMGKSPEAIREIGAEFEGVWHSVSKKVKTTKGQLAKEAGTEISEAEAKEPAERTVNAPVFEFGGEVLDTADTRVKTTEPVNKWIDELYLRALNNIGESVRDTFTVNGKKFTVSSRVYRKADSLADARFEVYIPKELPGNMWISQSFTAGLNPSISLKNAIQAITQPGYTEDIASGIERERVNRTAELARLNEAVANEQPFEREKEYWDLKTEQIAVERRIAIANANPRNHRFYRSLFRAVGAEQADQFFHLDGATGTPKLAPEVWNRLHIRLRLTRRGVEKTPAAIQGYMAERLKSDVDAATSQAGGADMMPDDFGTVGEAEKRASYDPALFDELKADTKGNPQMVELRRREAGLEKALATVIARDGIPVKAAERNLGKMNADETRYSDAQRSIAESELKLTKKPSRLQTTLGDKLAIVRDEIAKLEKRRIKQTADTTIPAGYTRMPSGALQTSPLPGPEKHLNIARKDMPQIMITRRGRFARWLLAEGVGVTIRETSHDEVGPTQRDFSDKALDKSRKHTRTRNVLISSDGYILDGHHQWKVAQENGKPFTGVWIDLPVREALAKLREFTTLDYDAMVGTDYENEEYQYLGEASESWRNSPDAEASIVNPINENLSPDEKVDALLALALDNVTAVDGILSDLKKSLNVTGKYSLKLPERIQAKASRPSIRKEKPWHDIEHVRDGLRFKVNMTHFNQLPRIALTLKRHGVEIVKLDTAKRFNPKAFGWRFVAFDLKMPNGQLVEFYAPLPELEAVKGINHKLFEKWRNVPENEIFGTPREAEFLADVQDSYDRYNDAFTKALKRMGYADVRAAEAAWTSFVDRAASLQGAKISMASTAVKPPGAQAPSRNRIEGEPVTTASSNLPDSIRTNTEGFEVEDSLDSDGAFTTESRKNDRGAQVNFKGLKSSPLPDDAPAGDVFRRTVRINPAPVEEAKAERREFGQNVSSGKLAGFGSDQTRAELDAIDAVYEFTREIQRNADQMKIAKQMLAANPADIDRKALDAVTNKTFNLTPADHLAIQLRIDQRIAEANGDLGKLAEAGALAMAYRMMRGDAGRLLQIGYDRMLTPAERHLAAITDAIFTPTKKIGKVIASKPIAEREAFIRGAAEARVKTVEAELAQLGLDIATITRKNSRLTGLNSDLMKEVRKLRKKLDQDILTMIQKGADKEAIRRRYGREAADQADAIKVKARAELKAKIIPMLAAGMTMEEIVAKVGKISSSPLPGSSPALSALEIEANRILAIAFGLDEKDVPEKNKLVKLRKPKAKASPAAIPVTATTNDWNRPFFKEQLASYDFDDKDLAGIKARVETLRMLAGAVGKIDKLEGQAKTKAEAALAEINAILAKYGTDVTDILTSDRHVEHYGFDINDINHVATVARTISTMDADWIDKTSEVIYANLLSGLQTMVVNATAVIPAGWEATVGRGMEMVVNQFMRDPMSAQFGELKYLARAFGPAISRAQSNFLASMQAQIPMADRDLLNMQPDIERIMGGKGYRMGGSIKGKLGNFVRIPTRLLMATDDFNVTLFGAGMVGAYAFRIAKAKKLKPGSPEFDREIRKQVNTPGSEAYILAFVKAKSSIFANPLPGEKDHATGETIPTNGIGDMVGYAAGKLTAALSKEHDSQFVKAVQMIMKVSFFPFQRVPFNILRKGVRYTPNPVSLFDIGLGFIQNSRTVGKDGKTVWKWNAGGRNPELVERIGQQIQGGILLAFLIATAAGEGDDDDQEKRILITGSSPFTPKGRAERETQYRSGIGPFRISILRDDGTRIGFNYGRLEPAATVLGATIDTIKAVKRADRSGKGSGEAAAEAIGGLVSQAQDKTFLRGVGDLVALVTNAIAEPDLRDNRQFQQFIAGRIALAIPNLIKQPIRELDSVYRERSNGFMQELMYQIFPYGQKAEKSDPYGQPSEKTGIPAVRIFDVSDSGTDKVHPVDRMLLRWRDSGQWSKAAEESDRKPWFPASITSTDFENPKTKQRQKMTDSQLAEYRKEAGRITSLMLAKEKLNYENPSFTDVEKVKKVVSESRRRAKLSLAFKFARDSQ